MLLSFFQNWAFAFLWDMSFYIPRIFSGIPHRSQCLLKAFVWTMHMFFPGMAPRFIRSTQVIGSETWKTGIHQIPPNPQRFHRNHMEITWKSHGNHMEITWKSHGNHMEITWKSPVSMKSEVPGLGVLDPTLPAHSSAWNGEAVLWVPCSRCLKFGVQCFKVSVTRQLHRFASFCGSHVRELGAPRLQISNFSALLTLALLSHIVCQKV